MYCIDSEVILTKEAFNELKSISRVPSYSEITFVDKDGNEVNMEEIELENVKRIIQTTYFGNQDERDIDCVQYQIYFKQK